VAYRPELTNFLARVYQLAGISLCSARLAVARHKPEEEKCLGLSARLAPRCRELNDADMARARGPAKDSYA